LLCSLIKAVPDSSEDENLLFQQCLTASSSTMW